MASYAPATRSNVDDSESGGARSGSRPEAAPDVVQREALQAKKSAEKLFKGERVAVAIENAKERADVLWNEVGTVKGIIGQDGVAAVQDLLRITKAVAAIGEHAPWVGPVAKALFAFADAVKEMREMVRACLDLADAVVTWAETFREVKARLEKTDCTAMEMDEWARGDNARLLEDFSESLTGATDLVKAISAEGWCGGVNGCALGTARRFLRTRMYAHALQSAEIKILRVKQNVMERLQIKTHDLQIEIHRGVLYMVQHYVQVPPSSTSSDVCIHNIPAKLPAMHGRDAELARLARALARPGSMATVTGLAGCGKSLLALRYAHAWAFPSDDMARPKRPMVWIFNAANEEQLTKSHIAALSALKDQPKVDVTKDIAERNLSPQALADELLEVATESRRKSLFVFDNVPDVNGAQWLARRFFSNEALHAAAHAGGRVIITSRSDTFDGNLDGIDVVQRVVVGPLTEEAGVAVLLADIATPSEADREAALIIHDRLGGIALGLSLMWKYVKDARVIERWGGHIVLRDVAAHLEKARDKLAASFETSIGFVRDRYPRSAAILDVAAFLDPESIPEDLLLHADGGCTCQDIVLLCEFNLLQVGAPLKLDSAGERIEETQMPSYSIHRVLQAFARKGRSLQGAMAAITAEIATCSTLERSLRSTRALILRAHIDALKSLSTDGGIAAMWYSKAWHKNQGSGGQAKRLTSLDKALAELDTHYAELAGETVIDALDKIEYLHRFGVRPSSAACIHNLPVYLPELYGREAELAALSEGLAERGSIVALTGMAGSGKSQLALRFACNFAFTPDGKPRLGDRLVWFLNAASEKLLVESYIDALAQLTGEGNKNIAERTVSPQALAHEMLQTIQSTGRKALLVFDNVPECDNEDGTGGDEWLAPPFSLFASDVRILITSRSNTFRGKKAGLGYIRRVQVGPMSEAEGIALLLGGTEAADIASDADREAARAIYERLDGHALALSVTRRYITNEEVMQIHGRLAFQEVAEGLARSQDAIGAALSSPLELVRNTRPRSAAVLDVAAWVDPSYIPESLLLGATKECAESDIDALVELNLLQRSAPVNGMPSYSMHRLLSFAARSGRSAQGALAAVGAEMALYEEFDVSTWKRARAMVPHAEALNMMASYGGIHDNVALATVSATVGRVLMSVSGDYSRALEAYEEALRIQRAALGDDHPDVATTRNNVGSVYQSQGRYAEALEAYEEALRIQRAVLGDDHPDVAMTRNNIGVVYQSQGRYAEALEAYEEAQRIDRAVLGDDHPNVATTRNNIGVVYKSQGRSAEALEAYKEALRIKRAALGDDHPDVATTLNNMGRVYQSQGRYAEALEAYKEALRIQRATLGDDHPDVATTRNNTGVVYQSQGRFAEALEAYEEALRIKRASLGDDHPDVATTLNNMGRVYQSQGRYAEALEAYKEALRIYRAVFHEDHPDVAQVRGNIDIVQKFMRKQQSDAGAGWIPWRRRK